MLLHHALKRSAQRLPNKTALVCGAERVTYAQWNEQAQAVAKALQEGGVQRGDRVVVLLENSIDFAVAAHGALLAGAVLVPVGPLTKAQKLGFIVRESEATALLTQASLVSAWAPAWRDRSALKMALVCGKVSGLDFDASLRQWPGESGEIADQAPGTPDDLAALIYTSGTTGSPKGVMLSHRNIISAWEAIQGYLQLQEDDVIGLVLPAAFSYGLNTLLLGLAVGCTVVIEPGAAFPVRLAETLARERVTVLPGVPTLFSSLLGLQGLERFDLRALRVVTNAAAALAPAHVQRLRQAWPHARIFSMYGLTECVRASYLAPEDLDARPGSVGRGMPPHQQHWLVDEDGHPLPAGSTGELVVCGPHVMQGYWQRPEDTEARLRGASSDGHRVLHTGDLFRTDAQGYLYFVARKDDIIKTRGEKVAPREVENAIYQLESVTGCAVVGVEDPALGHAVKAYVTLRPGSRIGERDIVRHCLASLENHMAPKFVEIVDQLPRTESGKIRHASLR